MSASTSGQATKVSFPNQLTSMAGLLFIPAKKDKTRKYPALVDRRACLPAQFIKETSS
jgi:hypothetical protein